MPTLEKIATLSELKESGRIPCEIDDYPALLLLADGQVYAIEDTCSHDQQPLGEAALNGKEITCPRHGARFDIATGDALCMPATGSIQTFAVEIRGEDIYAGPAQPHSTAVARSAATPMALPIAGQGECQSEGDDAADEPAGAEGDMRLIEALKQVIDPELMINIVDLGLIYNVEQIAQRVDVDMTLTSPACPAGPQIVQQAKMALERLRDVDHAEIKLTMTPPWTPERMTDDARDQLGIF